MQVKHSRDPRLRRTAVNILPESPAVVTTQTQAAEVANPDTDPTVTEDVNKQDPLTQSWSDDMMDEESTNVTEEDDDKQVTRVNRAYFRQTFRHCLTMLTMLELHGWIYNEIFPQTGLQPVRSPDLTCATTPIILRNYYPNPAFLPGQMNCVTDSTSTNNGPVKRKLQGRRKTTVPVSDYESDEIELDTDYDLSGVLSIFTDKDHLKAQNCSSNIVLNDYVLLTMMLIGTWDSGNECSSQMNRDLALQMDVKECGEEKDNVFLHVPSVDVTCPDRESNPPPCFAAKRADRYSTGLRLRNVIFSDEVIVSSSYDSLVLVCLMDGHRYDERFVRPLN
ncbi:hypothetical protein ANN_06803 [Periplaneta americana]|uniref:Uncharacterized protein n=1 Tax=Periplaneta americana TaxID=6978 RepID=A0ABQ8TF67_PERAM|nr:hypothetical protein ANN_06803 [Periplaneta americana]